MKRRHVVVDWWTEDHEYLDRGDAFGRILRQALKECGFNSVAEHFHNFEPKGFTGFILLSESHVAVHSWWEEELLTLDIFSCRPEGVDRLIEILRDAVEPKAESIRSIPRGVAEADGSRWVSSSCTGKE